MEVCVCEEIRKDGIDVACFLCGKGSEVVED